MKIKAQMLSVNFALAFVILMVAILSTNGCTRGQRKDAVKAAAEEYAQDLGYTFIGASGSTTDSDGDGYIAVDVRVKDNEGKTQLLKLECTYSYVGFETGCKTRVQGIKVKQ